MKKRVLALCLCLAMLLPFALTGCGNKTSDQAESDISKSASESAITLTMWLVAEQKPSTSTVNAITRAVNAITNAKFKIQLVLQYYTVDEYFTKLTDSIAKFEKSRATGLIDVEEEETEEGEETTAAPDETETNEYGLSVIKYPEVLANQVDIIYLGDLTDSNGKVIYGESLYQQFIGNGWLAELDSELSASSKKIKEYVSPNLLSAAKQNGVTYAIPNNNVIGEYTYMLLDKELMDYYNYQGNVFKSASGKVVESFYDTNVKNFLDEVKEDSEAEKNKLNLNGTTFVPVLNEIDGSETDAYNKCLELLASYWSFSTEDFEMLKEFSVFGCYYTDAAALSRGSVELKYESLFNNPEFVSDYLRLNEMRLEGYFKTAGDNQRAAVRFVTGDSTVLDKYNAALVGQKMNAYEGKDFYAVPVQYPTASSDDIFGSMFGVYTYSRSVSRSMEIITYLNTNADFRNLLQYGVEGTNYRVVTENNVSVAEYLPGNDYRMDIYKTGNAFLAYPQSTMSPDIWTRGKEQNRNSLVDPLLGFSVSAFAEEQAAKNENTSSNVGSYQVNALTGFSKALLSENSTLSAWIKKCDASGKGLYALKTSSTADSYTTYCIYVYNNSLSRNAKVEIVDSATFDGQNGSEQTPKGVKVAFSYSDAAGTSATPGYELSVVNVVAKKSLKIMLSASVNETATEIAETEDYLVNFDLNHTGVYDLEVTSLRIPSVEENAVLKKWISDCGIKRSQANGTEKNFLTYACHTTEDGRTEYCYLLYRPHLAYETALNVYTTGDRNGVTLHFDFAKDTEAPYALSDFKKNDDTYSYFNYLLYYAVITVDSGVKVNYTLNNAASGDSLAKTPADFDFDVCGTLDTEAVKYVQAANDALLAILNACTDFETFKQVVEDIGVMTSGKKFEVSDLHNPEVKDYANTLGTDGCSKLTEYINLMLSSERAHKTQEDENGNFVEVLFENGESFVYYDSPYALYKKWLQAYGFAVKK